ncbi:ribonucleotide reductase alpha subunit [Halolamina salifodinae]|uniref:Ribonucleoside-diphosphate reductase n=1 Tax=Halolamina salifodinae TaxID=1202767 RepID=A0A8T4GY53_9EURY|nr:LAGLIDADG family homing endonuclease [Halolamina salifodinae]MBP1986285.1 ribonucleotide reductase alpha subunit [Halolamina salifodinae]
MSSPDLGADELTLPIKRTDGETLEDRLTDNAYENILPARYLRKNADGEVIESQEELFARVAKNIALAEAVYEAERQDVEVTVTPDQLKPDHPRRDELAEDVFGKGFDATADTETPLTEHNVNKFAYDTVVPELDAEIADAVHEARQEFETLMTDLSFMPNSPTLMNAGDELQQLSACFVDSPADDITDIHQTAKEAAEVFQCLTDDARVAVAGKGSVSVADVEPGDSVVQRDGDGYRTKNVDEVHAYDDAPTVKLTTAGGVPIRGTPNHRLLVNGEWTELADVESGDTVSLRLGWLTDADETDSLTAVDAGPQWDRERTVSNEAVAALHAEGASDYDIAEELGCSASTVQRRRANELGLDPNGDGGRKPGASFDEERFAVLHETGRSDTEIADELGVHQTTVQQHRSAREIEANGEAVKTVSQPERLTDDLAELLGIWVGDGSVHEDGIRFHLNRDDVLNHVDTLARELFDTGIDHTWSDGCYEAVIHSHEVKRWWLENFGDAKPDSSTARVPDQLWQADHDAVSAFLRGLFSTDGTLTDGRYPRLYSASERLVDESLQLLLGVGIPATKWEWENEDRDYFSVAPTDATGLERFAEDVGYVDARSAEMTVSLSETPPEPTQCGTVEGTTWTQPVASVEEAEPATVYDLTVADDHEYVAQSVVSHNSGGGMGYAFWKLRPYGDAVGSTGGIASGPITFMRTFDQMCETIAQGGARRGAQMGVMRVSHPDVIQFIHAKNKDVSLANTLRLNDPDDFTHNSFADALEEARELIDDEGRVPEHLRNAVEGHLSNFNISVGITDDFMEALKAGEEFTFTNPRTEEPHVATPETKELYDMFGLGEHVEVGEVLSVPAAALWNQLIEGAHENGEPGVIYLERVNKRHSFDVEENPDHRILATNPCVTGETHISTENGLVPAEELYEQGTAQDVVVDGRLSEESIKEASSVYATGEKDVYALTTEEGYSLRLTADHRVMTDDGWVEASELDAGDTVHIQNRKGSFGQHGSATEGRTLGWLVGDGHLKHGEERAVLNFYDEDSEISAALADDVNEVVREPTGNADYEVGVNEINRGDDYRGTAAVEQRVRSTRLYEYAEQAGLAEEKLQVPDAVMRGSEEMARGFLQALFSADGGVQGKTEKGNSVRLTSVSTELLEDAQQLLLNFGIASKIYEERHEAGEQEMPDGNGGTATYERQADHDLVVAKDNLVRFQEEIGFLLNSKNEALADRLDSYDRGPYAERFEATVESVEHDGHETVYDLTEPDTNSFVANGLVVHNCGEQPLEEYEACNLGHINLSTLAAQDAPDWRVWADEHADEYGSHEAAVSAFLDEAMNWDDFDHRIAYGTRFLENVVTMSDFPVPEIEKKVREMRKIGLGVMGLAQLYIQLGVRYGTDDADEIARQLMTHINHGSKDASHELAEERGSFADWSDSKYADPTSYPDWFEHHTGEDPQEWEDGYPLRNHNTTTIAPTGCVDESSLVSTDEGLRPIEDLDETTAEFEQWDEIDVGVATDGGTRAATAVYDNGFANVRRIETENGFNVAATPNHRFRTLTADGEYAWKEAGEFEAGDRILLQRDTFEGGSSVQLDTSERENDHHNTDPDLRFPAETSPELAEFLGYFMGDGYVHEDVGVKLVVDAEATELDAHLRELGESLFGVTPTVEDRDTRHMLSFGGRHLPRYFEDNGWVKAEGNNGEGAASAFVPEAILQGDEATAKAFLRGLFEADGTASRKVELSTVSDRLADQVQTLLLSFGCVFARDTSETAEMDDHYGDRPRHVLRGVNRREDQRFLDEVGFVTKSTELELTAQSYKNDTYPPAVVDLLRSIDGYDSVDSSVKHRMNQSPTNGTVSRKLVRDVESETGGTVELDGRRLTGFYAATVETVTEEKAYTKDISVPSNNTYVADGFVTHNTTSMIGNTTGGCEPIYNVAYYKNVSGDVQGDEMLVEFDDYFLRALEDNDIDVEAVKKEAQEQMANNEFDGVEGLETVPTALGELFVVTGDLDAKQHASIQCAAQEGVDSAISKTVNAPNDSTLEDAKEAFEFVYDNGGKGVTYYRDGTRSKQVLTTRADNTEFADEDEAAAALVEQITEVFGGLESFLDNEDVQAALDTQVESLLASADGDETPPGRKRPRPDVLHGLTQRIDTGYGKLYVNINEDPNTGEPFELFANIGNSGGFTASFTEALAKTISTALRSGVDPAEIASELQGIRSPKVAWDKGEQIQSIPDAIGTAMRRYLDGEIDEAVPQQQTIDELDEESASTDGGATTEPPSEPTGVDIDVESPEDAEAAETADDATGDLIASGESPECPDCGKMTLYYSESCKTCRNCGWSEC